jgi:uncharacterized protein (TIGR02996 family)
MHDEDDFLRKVADAPADDTVRLVYADWLEERDDDESKAKARFLRLTVRLTGPIQRVGRRNPRQNELQRLAAKLPTDWLAVVSRLKVEMCAGKRGPPIPTGGTHLSMTWFFNFICDKRWDQMTTTDDPEVRFCEGCKERVHYCDTIVTARAHAARGHCVAVDLGIIRRADDIDVIQLSMKLVGRPSAADLEKERTRKEIDAVSCEREKLKRRQKAGDE